MGKPDLRRTRRSRFLLISVVCTLSLFLLTPHSLQLAVLRWQPAKLNAQPESIRARAFAKALGSWKRGGPPTDMLIAAAACTPRDATDGLFQHLDDTIEQRGVIDVGANKGWPVTKLALQSKAKWVVSVEPDLRNYEPLTKLKYAVDVDTVYRPVRGAVSDSAGTMKMAFHKDRDDFTCFNCLNTSREEVTVQDVEVHTVDSLVSGLQGNVALFKTDTQGHEASVLSGARRLLGSGRVEALLMEFDPKLLQKWENAIQALQTISKAKLRCLSLVFTGLKKEEPLPVFGKEIGLSNLKRFWSFVKKEDKYTDLFCVRR